MVKTTHNRNLLDREAELWKRLFGSVKRGSATNINTGLRGGLIPSGINDQNGGLFAIGKERSHQLPHRDLRNIKRNFTIQRKDIETIEIGAVSGSDGETMKRLKKGRLSIAARLDLHGFSLAQAYQILLKFLLSNHHAGSRCVLVITGKGGRFGKGIGKLKSELPQWLNGNQLKPVILAFSHALPRDGGEGAFYILLRKQ